MDQELPENPETAQPSLVLPRLELTGMMPDERWPLGWCATCAMRYMGALNEDKAIVDANKRMAEKAMAEGKNVVYFQLPHREDAILRHAITIAPSWYFQVPMPVCWVHIVGYHPQSQMQGNGQGSRIIPGKKRRIT